MLLPERSAGGLFCSLAFLPIGLIAFVASLLGTVGMTDDENSIDASRKSVFWQLVMPVVLWKPLLGGIFAVVGLTVVVSLLCEMNLLNVWIHNYHNHAGFYAQFERTAWKWWLVNPLELVLAAGVPVFFLLVRSAKLTLTHAKAALQQPLLVSFVSVWTLLWLSGKNSGEAARLWCPLLPILLAVAAGGLPGSISRSDAISADKESQDDRGWLILLSCQAVACAATVVRVSGFHF